ncbi:glutathione synthetase [Batrachochytrium salamandrivorans]|nr:glutathione synthetase [Batrachochytrium salamandrivorans]
MLKQYHSHSISEMPASLEAAKIALMDSSIDWAMVNGLMIHPTDKDSGVARPIHTPFALLPSPYPLEQYQLAHVLQPVINLLIEQVANDSIFLESVFNGVATVDEFTRRLYNIYLETLRQPQRQTIRLGIHRSDYLLHSEASDLTPKLLQVEVNTISAGLPSLSTIVSRLHKYTLESCALPSLLQMESFPNATLPSSESLDVVADGLGSAWKLYDRPKSVIVMVVQPVEFNIFDQRWIEYTVRGNGKDEVAVVYFRAGYTPRDYPTENEWSARTLLELSNAIKCPNIAYHLAGSKKIQQTLAASGVLERFISDTKDVETLKSTFTGLYPLDETVEGIAALEMAVAEPEKFVLKPQREGGGNNLYGIEIRHALQSMSSQERKAYILMDRIVPPTFHASVVRERQMHEREVVSELGVFGVWLRTKSASVDEGGVATGIAVIDTPLLISGLTYPC